MLPLTFETFIRLEVERTGWNAWDRTGYLDVKGYNWIYGDNLDDIYIYIQNIHHSSGKHTNSWESMTSG